MHVEHRKQNSYRARWIPAFATNDEQLRHVLAKGSWSYCHAGARMPDGMMRNLDALKKMVDAKFEKLAAFQYGILGSAQDEIHRSHIIKKHGRQVAISSCTHG